MENSKAVCILKTFSKKDLLSFEKMLISPYFECKQFTVKVFYGLKKKHPDFTGIDKKAIFKNAFPGRDYNDVLLRKSLSLIADYAQRFIKLQLLDAEPEIAEYGLVNYARRFKLFDICKKKLERFNEQQENTEVHFDYFLYRYMMAREEVFYKLAAFSQKDACKDVVIRNEFLLLDFVYKFALGSYEMNANKGSFNYDYSGSPAYFFYKSFDFGKFLASLSKDDKNYYVYEISSYLMKMTFDPDDETYFKLKDILLNRSGNLHFNFTFGMYSILSAYSPHRFRKENFEISRFLVENNFFLNYGAYFQLKDFIKVFKSALDAGETRWAENFFRENLKHLNPEHIENTELYCNAIMHYHKKEFERSLEYLTRVKYQLFSYKQDINVMALELHYELGNYEASFSMIDSYRHFLRENKFVEETARDRYNSFIAFYTRLLNARLKKEEIYKEGFKKEIESYPAFTGKAWLLEKLQEL